MVVMNTVQLITCLLPFTQHALKEVPLIRTRFIYDFHQSVVVQDGPNLWVLRIYFE